MRYAPSARTVLVDERREVMKLDVRNYTYDGEVQLIAARLYQTGRNRTPSSHRGAE